jgi:putative transposase
MTVLSRNTVLSANEIEELGITNPMRKLNKRKIRWICREMKKGLESTYRIARTQRITPRHTRRVYKRYNGVANPEIYQSGRPAKLITREDIDIVMSVRNEHPVCAVQIEKMLLEREIHMSHNRIHKILRHQKLAKAEPKKSHRRKWVRYQRRHSNSLWHTDWFLLNGRNTTAYLDDASRLVTAVVQYDNATAENSVKCLMEGTARYGVPKQIISDHGTQYVSLPRETCPVPEINMFQAKLKELKIQHIKARIKHPQSNGKLERFIQTIRYLNKHFGDLNKAVDYYNLHRPHMSLENGSLRTPIQAFNDKMRF